MSERTVATRDQFLKPAPIPKEDVPTPWLGKGVVVPVWGMTVSQRSYFERSLPEGAIRTQELRERLVVACCRDDEGKPLFQQEDVKAISATSAARIEPLVDAAMRLCGMTNQDVEDIAKNSEGTTGDESG